MATRHPAKHLRCMKALQRMGTFSKCQLVSEFTGFLVVINRMTGGFCNWGDLKLQVDSLGRSEDSLVELQTLLWVMGISASPRHVGKGWGTKSYVCVYIYIFSCIIYIYIHIYKHNKHIYIYTYIIYTVGCLWKTGLSFGSVQGVSCFFRHGDKVQLCRQRSTARFGSEWKR